LVSSEAILQGGRQRMFVAIQIAVNLVRAFYLNVSQFVLGVYTHYLEKVN
jgi:hypothetical protein